ncbi:hypothetical protein BN1723_009225 [Verticillium longisporum]|uniref:Peptide hydrolase n=1 Tax=Verticillium longisporum TaxID=100787 RepID=A0A0G4KMM2_VERLO|nr:hypothetical protein BN1723_009225 [Verticillium longisporum]
MRFLHSLTPALALLCAGAAQAASSWGFDDATVSILRKPEAVKETLSSKGLLKTPITLGAKESIKIALTTKENGKAKRPHQAFLILRDTATGLEAPFPLNVKENGKGTVEIAQKDLPIQHSITPEHLGAYIVIGSFGSSAAVESPLFNLKIDRNPDDLRPLSYEAPLRYGKLNEQTHHYRKHDTSPNILLSLIGLGLVVATYPALLAAWGYFGANLNHAQQALSKAPDIPFTNLIFVRDPPWAKVGDVGRLTLVAHYDSLYKPDGFIGAIDSAAPCAMLMQTALGIEEALAKKWKAMQDSGDAGMGLEEEVGVQILLLDGEEAWVRWTAEDSLYGSR